MTNNNNHSTKASLLLSIVIPVYNAERTLEGCIESVISQKFKGYEIIIINDGSTDNSKKICEKYEQKDKRIRLISTQNRGAYAARIQGIRLALGKYVTFLDSDDAINENCLEVVAEELKLNIDVLATSCKDTHVVAKEGFQKDLMSHKINAALHGRFFKNDILRDSLIDISRYFIIGEDFIINLRASLYAKTIKYSQLSIYNYNLNTESITQTFKRSWEYERRFHNLIYEIFLAKLPNISQELEFYYQLSFLKGCKLALLNNSRIDYTDIEWRKMRKLLSMHREKLLWDEKLVLDVPYSVFCRNLIRVLYRFI